MEADDRDDSSLSLSLCLSLSLQELWEMEWSGAGGRGTREGV